MNWKMKIRIQKMIASLPSGISYSVYYWLQRNLGKLRNYDTYTLRGLKAGLETWKYICSFGIDPSEKIFFEVGTGRAATAPISYWLMGAKKIITMDLNPYLKNELVQESIDYIAENKVEIEHMFSPYLNRNRLNELIELRNNKKNLTKSVFDLCQIKYVAPGDAANTNLENESIDFHVSYSVFEYIHPDVLEKIIIEGNRITKRYSLFVHLIDYSDPFSHSDKRISAINFLQYSDHEWNHYAGNRYSFINRLRHDDILKLFESAGHQILINQPDFNEHSLNLLKSGTFPLNEKFQGKSKEILSVYSAWIVTKKNYTDIHLSP